MDWKMPEMDGIETARLIESRPQLLKKPAVVMVTAYERYDVGAASKDLDIKAYLTKPVTPSSLLDAIMVSLGHAEVQSRSSRTSNQQALSQHLKKLSGAKILLVEDNEINQELALELLTRNGLFVQVANNGQEALDLLADEYFDGVLMDCQMPVMDGFTATKKLREQEQFKDLPILAMTANAMAGDREKVLAVGMNDHIAKPVNVVQMLAIMAKWITPLNPVRQVDQPVKISIDQTKDFPDLDGVNTVAGLARTQNNSVLYQKLLKKAQKNQINFINELDAAITDVDWELVKRLIHTLKGVAGNVGAEKLQQACEILETTSGNNQLNGRARKDVETEFNRFITTVDTLPSVSEIDDEITSNEKPFDKVEALKILSVLQKQLADFDTAAIEIMETNYSLFLLPQTESLLPELRQLLEVYDFDGAQIVVQKILEAIDDI
jgi:CheY-like chemotaxis protein